MERKYGVTYIPRGGNDRSWALVKVSGDEQRGFYATNLMLWGCGKTSATPEGAIRLLVQDMATILSIKPE